jgi:alpha-tubulin suppressor-like RCC1 family protein
MRAVFLAAVVLLASCEQDAARGAACRHDSDCQSPLVCALGRCRAECRESRDCEVGTHCLIEPATGVGVCSVPDVDVCLDTECPSGFVCAEGQCVNSCAAVTRCADGVCVDGACIVVVGDAGILDDAGLDASVDDADVDAGPACHGPSCDPVIDLDVRAMRTFAVTRGGDVWAWGDARSGNLGDGLMSHGTCVNCASTPVRVVLPSGAPLAGAVEVSAGTDFACARLGDGTVWCWGYNGEGQLGDGTGVLRPLPVQLLATDAGATAPVTDAVSLVVGAHHACIVRGAAREVWCWGQGGEGQLGTGLTMDAGTAVRATVFPAPVDELGLAYRHTLARIADGSILGVGHDDCIVLGAGAADSVAVSPSTASFGAAVSIATSTWNACALSSAGSVGCWGLASPVIGLTSVTTPCTACGAGGDPCIGDPQPINVPTSDPFERILGSGDGIYFGLTASGHAYLWGGAFGGVVVTQRTPLPVNLPGAASIVDAAADTHACVLTSDGDVYCFGSNAFGELGRGTSSDTADARALPVEWP